MVSWRVPNTSASNPEAEREYHLIPEGTYDVRIIDIAPPKRSEAREGTFWIRITLAVEGDRLVFAYVGCYLEAAVMIYRARKHWIDTWHKAKIIHVTAPDSRVWNHARIIWNDDSE